MRTKANIMKVSEAKAEGLHHSLVCCNYCKTPFKECDTLIPGKGLIIGETDVVEYRNRFWHRGCIFDYEKDKDSKDKYF